MRKRLLWRFLPALAGLGCLLVLARAEAQVGPPGRSHVPVPSRGGPIDPQQLFAERLRKADMFRELRKHVEDDYGKKLDDLLKDLKDAGIDPSSPEFARLIQEQLDRQAKAGTTQRLSPQEMEALQRLLKDLFPEGIKLTDPLLPMREKMEPFNPSALPGTEDKPPALDPGTGDAANPEWVQTAEDREALENASRQLIQAARWLENYSDSIRNSPALQRAAGDLAKILLENSNGRAGGLDSGLARLNQLAKQNGWLGQTWQQLRRLQMPSLPSLGGSGMPFASAASAGGLSARGPGQGFAWFLVLGAGLVVAVFVWKLLTRYVVWGAVTAAVDDWRLGPWPVAPSAVASRTDLVRAFEYLSLLLLGRKARNWNHREIAARMGSGAAERLAALYEHARYAPADEPLPERAVAEFRRDLCLLAGVHGA